MPDRDLIDDWIDDWIECPECAGLGYHDDCFEDVCVCLNPPCTTEPCDLCRGRGGWEAEDS